MIKTITYECMLISIIYIISVVCKFSVSVKPLFQTLHGCSLSLSIRESAREKVFMEFSGLHWAHAIETFWGIVAEHQCIINKLKRVKLNSFSRF